MAPKKAATTALVITILVGLATCVGPATATGEKPPSEGRGDRPAAATPRQPGDAPDEGPEMSPQMHKALRREIDKVDFPALEFRLVVDYLRQVSGLNLHVRWKVLERAGITRSSEITVRLKNVPFEKALRVVLECAGGETPLDFIVDDNVLTISTRHDLRRPIVREWEEESQELARAAERAKLQREIAMERIPVEHAEEMEMHMDLIERMQSIAFEPGAAGIIAIGALRDDLPREEAEVAEHLERLLSKTKSTGLRNAIRITLKDMYREMGRKEKVIAHLEAMLAENDQALLAAQPKARE